MDTIESAEETVPAMIREQRRRKGWTQRELMRRSGIDKGNICRLENGHIPVSVGLARKLGKAFNCSHLDFLV